MSEENPESQGASNENQDGRPEQNLKAEFDRKFQNLQAQNQKLAEQSQLTTQQLDAVLKAVEKMGKSSGDAEQDLEYLKYEDPDKYAEIKSQEVEKRIMSKLEQDKAQERSKTETLQRLAQIYPEINDSNSELTQKALEIHGKLGKGLQDTGEGYEMAILRAATEIGVLPVSKRKKKEASEDVDEFISGGNSGGNADERKNKNSTKLDYRTIEFAKLLGLDVDDPKVQERLKNKATRTNWKKWQ